MSEYTYKDVKNLMNLFEFCDKKIHTTGDSWKKRYMRLLDAFYELEYKILWPASLELNDLIDFANNHDDAIKLKEYLNILPGFKESTGKNQCPSTVCQHGFVAMCGQAVINDNTSYIIEPSRRKLYCSFKLDGNYILIKDDQKKTLNVEFDNYKILIEKLKKFPPNTYVINGVVYKNIEFDDLVNMITFAQDVKDFNKDSVQVAYAFLHN